jgi:uncharacterized membrane protein
MSSIEAANTQSQITSRKFTLRHLSLLLVVIGLLITGYLSYSKLFNTPVACIEGSAFDCSLVESSAWSRIMGIPVAYLGFGAYVTIGLLLLLEPRVGFLRDYGPMLVLAITLFGFIYHLYLTYISVFVLQALCPWCLTAEATMTVLMVVSGLRLRQVLKA